MRAGAMTWIRSPTYDCIWILSAPVLALLLVIFPGFLGLFLLFNFAHAVSPIVLAWTHRDYREIMLARPRKFIGVPIVLALCGIGIACSSVFLFPEFAPHHMALENVQIQNLTVPIVMWANLYAVWNLYHAGAQNFGIWCLYRGRGYQPGWTKWVVLGGIVALTVIVSHEIPQYVPVMAMFAFGLVSFNHSLAEIGLCAHVHARHHAISPLYFIGCMLFLGGIGSTLFMQATRTSLLLAILALSLRGALGIWHFLQDRWIWKLSDPQVRATIGKELFA